MKKPIKKAAFWGITRKCLVLGNGETEAAFEFQKWKGKWNMRFVREPHKSKNGK